MGELVLDEANLRSRALAAAWEPVVGSVYFAPEAHEAFASLGFDPSPGPWVADEWGAAHWGKVLMVDYVAYFTSRGALLGQVPGEVVAAAFGVFNPAIVVPAVAQGRAIADAGTVVEARTKGAVAHLVRILGAEPDGLDRAIKLLERAGEGLEVACRPMYAGLLALPLPDEPVGTMWHLAERLREYRGDAHVAAFTTAGFGGCALQVLTERCAGMPPRTYTRTRGWSDEDLDAAESWLTERGLLEGGGAPTAAGRREREEVERATDRLCAPMVDSLGDDVVELVGLLQRWSNAIRAANGYYPSSPQEALMPEPVQEWMTEHGLARFGGVPDPVGA